MGFIGIVTIGIFVFFTPVFVLLFGFCSVLFGVVAVIQPSRVRRQRMQSLSRIRVMGIGFCMLGLGASIVGGSLAKDFYQGDSSKNIASNFSFQDAPESNGSDVSRPETEEEQPESVADTSTKKSTNSTVPTTGTTSITTEPSSVEQSTKTTSPTSTQVTTTPTSDSLPGKGLGRDKKQTIKK